MGQWLISGFPKDAAAPVFLWSGVEVSIGIMIAGAMECGPLMAAWGVKGFESFGSTNNMEIDDVEPLKMETLTTTVDGKQFMERDLRLQQEDIKGIGMYHRDREFI